MTLTAKVRNGRIELPDGVHVPDGAEVQIILPTPAPAESEEPSEGLGPTLYETLKDFIGKAEGLPADFADEHDHYLHGAPRRSEL